MQDGKSESEKKPVCRLAKGTTFNLHHLESRSTTTSVIGASQTGL